MKITKVSDVFPDAVAVLVEEWVGILHLGDILELALGVSEMPDQMDGTGGKLLLDLPQQRALLVIAPNVLDGSAGMDVEQTIVQQLLRVIVEPFSKIVDWSLEDLRGKKPLSVVSSRALRMENDAMVTRIATVLLNIKRAAEGRNGRRTERPTHEHNEEIE